MAERGRHTRGYNPISEGATQQILDDLQKRITELEGQLAVCEHQRDTNGKAAEHQHELADNLYKAVDQLSHENKRYKRALQRIAEFLPSEELRETLRQHTASRDDRASQEKRWQLMQIAADALEHGDKP